MRLFPDSALNYLHRFCLGLWLYKPEAVSRSLSDSSETHLEGTLRCEDSNQMKRQQFQAWDLPEIVFEENLRCRDVSQMKRQGYEARNCQKLPEMVFDENLRCGDVSQMKRQEFEAWHLPERNDQGFLRCKDSRQMHRWREFDTRRLSERLYEDTLRCEDASQMRRRDCRGSDGDEECQSRMRREADEVVPYSVEQQFATHSIS